VSIRAVAFVAVGSGARGAVGTDKEEPTMSVTTPMFCVPSVAGPEDVPVLARHAND
jgi:hypothetical protein